MEVNEIQTQAHKFSSINSNAHKIDSTKVLNNNPIINNAALWDRLYSNNGVENPCETLATENTSTEVPALGVSLLASRTGSVNNGNEVGNGLLRGWQQSSRIIRVSRASGGKDRHSKVWTAKGARDRRVRLSVTTAIQFYDLQDRLGLDQPSKAVEWLIQAASDAITELPPLDDGSTTSFPPQLSTVNGFASSFPGTPRQQRDDERRSPSDLAAGLATDSSSLDGIGGAHRNNQTHNLSSSNLSKSSDYNTPSGTSKGSGDNLSIISRIENGVKLSRDNRSRKRTAKQMDSFVQSSSSPNTTASSSFTQLLTASIGIVSDEKQLRTKVISSTSSPSAQAASTQQQWCTSSSSTADYFSHISPIISTSRPSSGFIQLENSIPQVTDLLHQQYYHPYAVADNPHRVVVPVPVPAVAAGVPTTTGLWAVGSNNNNNSDIYHDLNFSISSPSPSLSVLNNSRGTLQSNSQLQRFSSSNFTLDGSSQLPFFIGAAADTHHQYQYQQQQFPSGLQLYFGDTNGSRHSDQKEKEKN